MATLFFVVAKLVGFLIKVETWIALLLCLTLVSGRRFGTKFALAALLSFVIVGVFPVGEVLLRPLEAEYQSPEQLDQVDGIVVLGGAESVRATRRWNQPQLNGAGERLSTAASLALRHPEAVVLYSGGSGRVQDAIPGQPSLPPIAVDVLTSLGVASDRIMWEHQSRNTVENARLSVQMVQPGPDETWVLVTSAFHMGRAMSSYETAGWIGLVPYPVDYRTGDFLNGIGWDLASNLDDLNIAIKEWIGRVVYRLTGR
jgi:uncharacterized SAM-binding protein YcdF (DUF218 family)|tara:strand:+ start:249 stop:1019 length:771 start_codon:yes stop_codon:yes gene_type:complete